MSARFDNRMDWIALLGAFAVWLAHFMLLWTVSSIFPGQRIVLWIALALTIAAFATLAWLWHRRASRGFHSFGGIAIAVAALGVGFDFLPSLLDCCQSANAPATMAEIPAK